MHGIIILNSVGRGSPPAKWIITLMKLGNRKGCPYQYPMILMIFPSVRMHPLVILLGHINHWLQINVWKFANQKIK